MRRPLLGIFVLALLVRLAWVVTLGGLTWSDEMEFADIARHLVAGDGFVSSSYRANPVLPAYLAAVFSIFGENLLAARVGQALFGALTCILVAATAEALLGSSVGILSGVLLALYLPHIYLSGVFYVECLFTMLIALSVYVAVRSLDPQRSLLLSDAVGVIFAVTALTRPVFLVSVPVLCAVLFCVDRRPLARRVAASGVLLAAFAFTILPWAIRNYRTFGKVIPISTGFGTKLWQGNNEISGGDENDRELYWFSPIWRQRLEGLPPADRLAIERRYAEIDHRVGELQRKTGDQYIASDTVLLPVALEYMRTHSRRTFGLFARKLATLFLPFSRTITENTDTSARNRILAAVSYLPVLALAIAGMWLGVHERRELAVLYALIISNAGAYGVLNACTRFRLPLDPYLIVFASLTLHQAWRWWTRQSVARHDMTTVAA